MKKTLWAAFALLALLTPAIALTADVTGKAIVAPAGKIPSQAIVFDNGAGLSVPVSASNPLPVTGGGGGGGSAGTEYTEDAASAANPIGGQIICRRRDTLTAAEVSADGDNIAWNCTNKGEGRVRDGDLITALGSPFQAGGALGAGENHVGEIGGKTIIASSNFTTPAGTTAYASGDLIANNATAGSVTPMSFTVCRVNAGTGMIRRARIKTTDTGFAAKGVILKLYKDSPTSTNGDNGAWLTTESNYLGQISVTLDQHFSDPMEKGVGTPSAGSEINYDCATGTSVIYGLLVANEAITPQGAKVHTIVLEALVN